MSPTGFINIRTIVLAVLTFGFIGATWLDDVKNTPEIVLPESVTDADYYENGKQSQAKVELGKVLFFDQLLSGNRNISCATCHHPKFATTDTVALPLGQGPSGLGLDRQIEDSYSAIHERVPRNSPALFNLGAKEFVRMFHDGRVEVDAHGYYESGFITPAKWKFPKGLDNVLAAQAMFPVSSPDEMAGHPSDTSIISHMKWLNNLAGPDGLWEQVARRLRGIPEYVEMFKAVYPGQVKTAGDITTVLAANAIAAFEAHSFRADQSPFDVYLRTGKEMSPAAMRGMKLFYGKANCASCHSGKFQTDHEFHAIAMPQIGPGKADGYDDSYWRETGIKAFLEDFGRGRETKREEDRYKFRTPSLRNVELTAPYGHAGTYETLESVIRHHLDPVGSLHAYEMPQDLLQPLPAVKEIVMERDPRGAPKISSHEMSEERRQKFLKRDTWVMKNDKLRGNIASANELEAMELSDSEVMDLIAFLKSLTDPRSRDLAHTIPDIVPSGHIVER